jgi:signal transduction histidine kinase
MIKVLNKRFLTQSIRTRLAFYFTLAFGSTLILTSALCYQIFVSTHQANFDAALYNHAVDVASAIDPNLYGGIDFHPFSPLDFEKHVPFSVGRSFMELRDPNGNYIASSNNLSAKRQLPFDDSIRNQVLTSGVNYKTITSQFINDGFDTDYRMISYVVNKPGIFPLILQIAVPLTIIQENQKAFFDLLLFLIPTGIIISTFLALWASRRAFSPVLQMTKQTAQIEVKNLSERIEVIESDQELKELGRTLNLLLDRVENSVVAQDRFVADASHQLKTPLAIVQGELELLLKQSEQRNDLPEFNHAIGSIKEEVSTLIRLVENLLILARMDAGYGTVPFHTVRLDEVVSESVRRYRRIDEKLGINISVDLMPNLDHSDAQIDFEIQGDVYLLRCLIDNLIDNAVKYSAKLNRGNISVKLAEFTNSFHLEVEDHGQGMNENELLDLFTRFKRDPKKSLEIQGSGLGLVIVKRIAELHRGEVKIKSTVGLGTTVSIEFKK